MFSAIALRFSIREVILSFGSRRGGKSEKGLTKVRCDCYAFYRDTRVLDTCVSDFVLLKKQEIYDRGVHCILRYIFTYNIIVIFIFNR